MQAGSIICRWCTIGGGNLEVAQDKFAEALACYQCGVCHFYRLAWEGEQQDYFVFALYLIDAWLPSQNGLFFDAPHRQMVTRLRIS
jgi:hypothetical protein